MDTPLGDRPAELQFPDVGVGEEAIELIGDKLKVPGKEAENKAGCRQRGGLLEQDRRHCPGRNTHVGNKLVNHHLQRDECAHARIGSHRRSSVPRPHMAVANVWSGPHPEQIQQHRILVGDLHASAMARRGQSRHAASRGMIQHPVDQSQSAAKVCPQ